VEKQIMQNLPEQNVQSEDRQSLAELRDLPDDPRAYSHAHVPDREPSELRELAVGLQGDRLQRLELDDSSVTGPEELRVLLDDLTGPRIYLGLKSRRT